LTRVETKHGIKLSNLILMFILSNDIV